jgi:hypothetical protein
VLSPFLTTLSLFLASSRDERDPVAEVAPTRVGHRADPELVRAHGDEPVGILITQAWPDARDRLGQHPHPALAHREPPAPRRRMRAHPPLLGGSLPAHIIQ